MRLFVRGRVERTLSGPVVSVSHYAQLGEGEAYRGELVPIYRASKDLASRKIAAVVKKNFRDCSTPRRPIRCLRRWPRLGDTVRSEKRTKPSTRRDRLRRPNALANASSLRSSWRWQLRHSCVEASVNAITMLAPLQRPGGLARTLRAHAAVRAHRRATTGDSRNLARHGPRRSDEPAVAGRRREREDARCSGRYTVCRGKRHAIGVDGADRTARVAARRQTRAAALAVRGHARGRLWKSERAIAQCRPREARRR